MYQAEQLIVRAETAISDLAVQVSEERMQPETKRRFGFGKAGFR